MEPKPASPVLQTGHAFALSAVAILTLHEGTGQPGIIQGPHGDGTPVTAPVTTFWNGAVEGTWITNSEGTGLRWSALTTPLRPGVNSGSSGAWLPTGDMTLLLVRGKLNSTLLNGIFWRGGDNAGDWDIYLPYVDGTLYFDYGGQAGANRLTKAGLTYSTSSIDYWVFTAGAAGSAIWQNGVKQNSQGTGITKNASSSPPYIGQTVGETQDLNFLQINDSQWDDATIEAWFDEPYEHLIEPAPTTFPTHHYNQQRRGA
jgi:hypothetical protein